MSVIDIPKMIKLHLKKHNLTQKEFANNLNVSQPLVSAWILGSKQPSFENLQKIFKELSIAISNQEEDEVSNKELELLLLNKIINNNNITIKELSNLLSIDYESVRRKLKGTRKLYNHEFVSICQHIISQA